MNMFKMCSEEQYMPDDFYTKYDEYGLMERQDLLFECFIYLAFT